MSENVRAPRTNEVDQLVAVEIPQVRAVAALNEQRLAADTAERAGRAVHSAGDRLQGSLELGLATFTRNRHEKNPIELVSET